MLAPATALRVNQLIFTLFSIGMMFFPAEMMQGYKGDPFTGEDKTMFMWMMGIFGLQMMVSCSLCAGLAADVQSNTQQVQSLACLLFGIFWLTFAVIDYGLIDNMFGTALPSSMPAESILANVGLFVILGLVSIVAWATSGMALPNFGALGPKGSCAKPVWAGIINLVFFAVGCAFFADEFREMFIPGVMAGLPDSARSAPMIMIIMRRAGYAMLFNMGISLCVMSVGDDMTTYRFLRVWTYGNLVYLGYISRENALMNATGWPNPMRISTTIQCFLVTFYQASTLGSTDVQFVPAAADKKKK